MVLVLQPWSKITLVPFEKLFVARLSNILSNTSTFMDFIIIQVRSAGGAVTVMPQEYMNIQIRSHDISIYSLYSSELQLKGLFLVKGIFLVRKKRLKS